MLPFSLAVSAHLYFTPLLSMNSQGTTSFKGSEHIKVINDIGEYVEKEADPNRAVILCELHEDEFIDQQLIQLAQ
jgi:hypothetical protein